MIVMGRVWLRQEPFALYIRSKVEDLMGRLESSTTWADSFFDKVYRVMFSAFFYIVIYELLQTNECGSYDPFPIRTTNSTLTVKCRCCIPKNQWRMNQILQDIHLVSLGLLVWPRQYSLFSLINKCGNKTERDKRSIRILEKPCHRDPHHQRSYNK